jgi:hypothetical protein
MKLATMKLEFRPRGMHVVRHEGWSWRPPGRKDVRALAHDGVREAA